MAFKGLVYLSRRNKQKIPTKAGMEWASGCAQFGEEGGGCFFFLLSWHIIVWGFCVLVFAFFVCPIIGVHWGGLFLYSGGTGWSTLRESWDIISPSTHTCPPPPTYTKWWLTFWGFLSSSSCYIQGRPRPNNVLFSSKKRKKKTQNHFGRLGSALLQLCCKSVFLSP